MPNISCSGYTAKLVDNDLSFKDFALLCARAMGYLINMRDDSLNVPIPEELTVNPYHAETLEENNTELDKFSKMSYDERVKWGEEQIAKQYTYFIENKFKTAAEMLKVRKVYDKVVAWDCPTSLASLKKFMLEQLRNCLDFNTDSFYDDELDKLEKISPIQFYQNHVDNLKDNIAYHAEKQKEEVKWINDANAWLKLLRESLNESI
jgi:hypothetical protein